RLHAARHVLLHLLAAAPVRANTSVRAALFAAAARGLSRDDALAAAARTTGLPPQRLLAGLFADLPDERPLRCPEPKPSPATVLLAHNRALAQSLLRTAERADLLLLGAARALLRTAWLVGASLTVVGSEPTRTVLRWARPAATPGAARKLAALVPLLPWARHFELRARCRTRDAAGTFVLTSADALLPGPEPAAFDSRLERDFARSFTATAPDWQLVREPAPLARAGTFAFPDFLLAHRHSPAAFWLELAGLRDRAALPGKLALLHAEPRYLLCLPRAAVPTDLLGHPRVVPFTRSVAVADVLRTLSTLRSPP
ncbi:MAG: DUF790 family protein, partial [Planctomycetota bacterium]